MLTYAIRSSPNTYINLKIMVKRSSGKKCLKRGARANDLRLVRKKTGRTYCFVAHSTEIHPRSDRKQGTGPR